MYSNGKEKVDVGPEEGHIVRERGGEVRDSFPQGVTAKLKPEVLTRANQTGVERGTSKKEGLEMK